MTLKEMRDEVVQTLGLQQIAAYNEAALVTTYLNRGVIDLLSRTRCVVRCVHLKTTAEQDTYRLDHAIMTLVDVEDGAQRLRRNQSRSYGGFTLIRSDILRIPTPSEDGEVDIWGVLRPAPMTNDTDDVGAEAFGSIPDEFQDAVILYALWKASDYADDQTGGQGDRYRLQYEGQDTRGGRLREIRLLVNKRGTAKAPRMRGSVRGVSDRTAWVG